MNRLNYAQASIILNVIDGAWVVYTTRSGDKSTLWQVPLEGGTPQQLTDYQAIEPSFSPDGKLISCILPHSSKVERGSLAILSADGRPPNHTFPVVQFAHYYVTPRWSPAGKLFFTQRSKMASAICGNSR